MIVRMWKLPLAASVLTVIVVSASGFALQEGGSTAEAKQALPKDATNGEAARIATAKSDATKTEASKDEPGKADANKAEAKASGTAPAASSQRSSIPSIGEIQAAREKLARAADKVRWIVESGRSSKSSVGSIYEWSRRALEYRQSLMRDRASRLELFREHLKNMIELQKRASEGGESAEIAAADYFREEAELWLMEARALGGSIEAAGHGGGLQAAADEEVVEAKATIATAATATQAVGIQSVDDPHRVPPIFPSLREARKKAINQDVFRTLDQPIGMLYPNDTPLEEVLDHIREESKKGPTGKAVSIYVDPIGLSEADKTMASTVSINLEGVPLRVSLALLLKQLGMTYFVNNGLIFITYENTHERIETFIDPDGPFAEPEN